MAVALALTLALGFLYHNIISLQGEIDQLYAETVVNAELRQEQEFRRSGRILDDIVPMGVVRDILDLGIVKEMYLEGAASAFLVEVSDAPLSVIDAPGGADILVGVAALRHLTEEPDGFMGRDISFNMDVQFAPGFSEDSFTYTDGTPIPVVISRELMQSRGLALGDRAYIVYYEPVLFRQGEWRYAPAVVMGTHDGAGLPDMVHRGAVIPLPAMENMLGNFTGFLTFKFSIDPAFNRNLADVGEQLDDLLQCVISIYPWRDRLAADIWDQELRFGVTALEQHVLLLQLLFPIAMGISGVIGAGLAMLLLLQNAKNAAIMRVLGMSKGRVQLILWLGQIILCVGGGLAGLLLIVAIGWRADLLTVVMSYWIGAAIGAAVGAILVTNRAPLDLLQVKE